MKKSNVTALLALASFITAGSALAETVHEVRADVPFNFVVGNKVLPSGHYRIDQESTNEVLIRNSDQPQFAVLTQVYGEPQEWAFSEWATRATLTFDQYGNQHFLSEIRGPVAAVNAKIPTSKVEKDAQLREGE